MKKLILSLFVGFVGIISFCSATVYDVYTGHCNNNGNFCKSTTYPNLNGCNGNYYLVLLTTGDTNWELRLPTNGFNLSSTDSFFGQSFSCSNNKFSFIDRSTNGFDYVLKFVDYDEILNIGNSGGGSCPDCPTCDDPYTSLECQTEYNLIPVEDVDINYCVGNGLCPNECGSGTDLSGDLQYSNIYINSILHPGEENIFIDIPDYIQWDYSVDTGNFNIYVGSGYDMDYMNSIIKINSYRPTSSDFTNIFVSGLTLIFPYIFVLLLIVFIWKLIKRVFK